MLKDNDDDDDDDDGIGTLQHILLVAYCLRFANRSS